MNKSFLVFFLINLVVFSQEKIKVGIWENFDIRKIPLENLLINTKEKQDGKDNDKNGYIDDIIGIGFDEFENVKIENFTPTSGNSDLYEHGVLVANVMLSKNKDIALCGVGFEYTSVRLNKSGLLKLSTEKRLKQLPKEFKKMKNFVSTSVNYFAKKEVRIVNLSWGLDLDRIIELNPNLGDTYSERKENATLWLTNFQKYLTEAFQKNQNILFVVAAGNEGVNSTKAFDVPGIIDLPNVVVVGALSKTRDQIAYFSNFGTNITIYAPGESVKSINIEGIEVEEDGTSLAAPFISAYAANLLQDKLTPFEIKQKLMALKKIPF